MSADQVCTHGDVRRSSNLLLTLQRSRVADNAATPEPFAPEFRGVCEGNPQTETQQRSLTRWLEDQLRPAIPNSCDSHETGVMTNR